MRTLTFGSTLILLALAFCAALQSPAFAAPPGYTLTVVVHGVNEKDGNIGVLVFNSEKGWAEDRTVALKDVVVPAQPGTVTVTIPDLPAGDYGVAICHDVNQNHKLDKNFLGMPKEQWGLSNDPHATIKAPPFSKSRFTLKGNQEIHVQMQGPK